MSRAAVLALDQGSSSSRVIAFDERGKILASAQRPVRTFQPRAGWFEHDAGELALSLERCLDDVIVKLPKKIEILGAGLACQRSTVVFWDKSTGKPAARAPSWQDGRAVEITAALQDQREHVHKVTGLYLTPYYSAPKIRWYLDHEPQVRRLADAGTLAVAPVSSWLTWRLTGGLVFAADPTTAQRTLLLDMAALKWDAGLLSFFGVPAGALPEVRPSAADWGFIERKGRRFPILASIGDQQAAALGLGARREGAAVANYGTGAFLLVNAGHEPRRAPGLLTSVGWNARGKAATYLLEGTVHAAGTSFDWLRSPLGLLPKGADIDKACRASKERVWVLPAIGGLGAPRWDYTTKTALFGLSTQTRPEDIVRGTADGLCHLMADIAAAMRKAGLTLSSINVAGGLSRSLYLMQTQADLFGVPLARCDGGEATARGAAFLAAQHAGLPWADALAEPKFDRAFQPKLPPADRIPLRDQWTKFVDAQAALSRAL